MTVSEAESELGGRVLAESALKGLLAWKRVRDIRVHELQQLANVSLYTNSRLTVDDIYEFSADKVILATGSRWRTDGVGRSSREPISGVDKLCVMAPEDIMSGDLPGQGPVVVYDDDQVYLAGVVADHLADKLKNGGPDIHFVTPASVVSPWCEHTLEQQRIQKSLLEAGVHIHANHTITSAGSANVTLQCIYTAKQSLLSCGTLVPVTERVPDNALFESLAQTGIAAEVIGDAFAPGLIADAVFTGHLAARSFQEDEGEIKMVEFRRELPSLESHAADT